MATVTSSLDVSAEHVPSRLTGTLARTTVSAGVLAAAVTTVGAVGLRVAGSRWPFTARSHWRLSPRSHSWPLSSAGCSSPLLNRRSSAPRRQFVQVTIGLRAISCSAPAAFADITASRVALVGLHLVAAAIIVPALARHAH